MSGDEARLLERLLADPAFRRRFEQDPAAVAREAGLGALADALASADDGDGRTLDVRESRSSAAGVFMAAALEGLGVLDLAGTASPIAPSSPLPEQPAPPLASEPDLLALTEARPQAGAPAAAFSAITPEQVEADQAARLAASAQEEAAHGSARAAAAALPPDPDDWEGNLDDEDAGSDEVDGSNENEADESGGEDDDSDADSGSDEESDDGGGDDGSDEQRSDDDRGDDEDDENEKDEEEPDEEEPDENENEGGDDDEDEVGEGSSGEDADDDESDGDSSDDADDSDDDSDSDQDAEAQMSGEETVEDGGYSGLDDAPDEFPGDDAAPEDVAAWMGARAVERGLPPELPVMTALVESGMHNLDHGDADSVGLFQMRLSVWNSGDYSGYPDDPDLQLDWFLDHAEVVGQERLARGLPVDEPSSYGAWIADVQRPATQFRGRYQERLDDARALLARAGEKQGDQDDLAGSADSADAAFVSPEEFDRTLDLSVGGAKWANLGGPDAHHARALGNWQSDNAWDLGVPVGTPVYAVDDGVVGPNVGVMSSRPSDGARLTLNGSGNNYWYGHLSRIVVEPGQHVKRGELVGYSGASQNGVAHLHLGVQDLGGMENDDEDDDDGAPDGDERGDDAGGGSPHAEDGVDGLQSGRRALTALAAARTRLGTPYRWGGSDPETGFDCSGLVQWAYAKAGISIPRVTDDQIDVGRRVSRSDLLPGDLVFFRNSSDDVHHVGMYIGGDRFIHSPHTGDVVKVSSLNDSYYAREFTGGRRVDQAVPQADASDVSSSPEPRRAPGGRPRGEPEQDAAARKAAERRLARDAAEVRRPGSRLFRALERQERGKTLPADDVPAPPGRSEEALPEEVLPEEALPVNVVPDAVPAPSDSDSLPSSPG